MKNKIILNEKEYAEECLKKDRIEDNPYFTITILAKYYYHCLGYRKAKITTALSEFIKKYPDYMYGKRNWDRTILKVAANAGSYPLYEIDGVWITDSELRTISTIEDKILEQIAFTLLCLAKLGNSRNPENNGWVNYNAKDILELSNVSCSTKRKYELLSNLRYLDLIEFPRKNDNLKPRVKFIDESSEKILCISDFRNLGYAYRKHLGENYTHCYECGILMKNNKNKTRKYCDSCKSKEMLYPGNKKSLVCVDCGELFEVSPKNTKSMRCQKCQYKRNNECKRTWDKLHKAAH